MAAIALSIGMVLAPAVLHAQSQIAIGFVWQTPADPMLQDAEERSFELGIGFRSCGGLDASEAVVCIEALIDTGVNGLLVAPGVGPFIEPSLQLAREYGLPVMVLTTPFDEGTELGWWARARAVSTDDVGVLLPPFQQDASDAPRVEGLAQVLGANVMEYVADDDTPDAFYRATEALLQSHPGVGVIYASNERAATGASEAIAAAGRVGDVTLVGHGGCVGVSLVESGRLGALSLARSAGRSVDALVFGDGAAPASLVTNQPVSGVVSNDTGWGAANCIA
jgi:ABC-type sugar transport system substrate-binding protein